MKTDSKLRTILFTMLSSFDNKKVHLSLQKILSYLTSSDRINVIELIFKEEHLLGNSILLIVSSIFFIILHFINIL